jgi:hypothetical protein
MTRLSRLRLLTMMLLAAACPARTLRAHIVPVPPSVCAFEPIALAVPATGLEGGAQAAGSADAMRVLYDASASQLQLCPVDAGNPSSCGAPVPRAFTLGSASGTLTFPGIFNGRMLSSGDVTVFDLPVTVTLGAATTTVRITLTTGLVSVNGAVAQGTPLLGLGSFTLVGRIDGGALPAPLAADPMLVTLSCQPRPVPDKTQFVSPLAMAPIRGQLTTDRMRLRTTITVSSSTPPDLTHAMLLAVDLDGKMVGSAVFPAGVSGGRVLTGTSDDGNAVLTIKRASAGRLVVSASLRNTMMPLQSPGAPVLLDLTLDGGSFIGRGEQLFRTSGSGRTVKPA